MAFNLNIPNNAFRLTPQEAGYGDYGQAFHQGMLNFGKEQESINTPKRLAEALLAQHLQNLINKPKAEHAEEITMADLQSKRVGTAYKNELMKGLPTLNELRREQADRLKFKRDNPLLGTAGDAGQIAAALYLQQHPELNAALQYGNGQAPSPSGQAQPNMQQPNMPSYAPTNQGSQQDMPQYTQPNAQAAEGQSFIPAIGSQQDMQQPMQLAMNYPNMQQPEQQPQQDNKPYSQRILEGIAERHARGKAQADYQQKRANAFAYATAPVDVKTYMIAQAAGMGINPDIAVNEFAKGKTIPDLARENGFDPDRLPPVDYLATKGNMTKFNDRKAYLAEMNVLSDKVQEGIAPYAYTIKGWSPKQVTDFMAGKSKDQQIKYYAARGIIPELINMRLLTPGARGTVHAIKTMQDKALLNIKAFESGMPGDVWIGAQKAMDESIAEAMAAGGKAYNLKGKAQIMKEQGRGSQDLFMNPNASNNAVKAPQTPSWVKDDESARRWLKTLTPQEREAHRREQLGE